MLPADEPLEQLKSIPQQEELKNIPHGEEVGR